MQERRNPFSPWYDSIATMDMDWSTHPLFYFDDDLDFLQGSYLKDQITSNRKSVVSTYEFILEYIAPSFAERHSAFEFSKTHKIVES